FPLPSPQGSSYVWWLPTSCREHLRRLLNWEEFDELRDSRRSILLDTLYESIIFAVGKGFPWVEVAQVVKFTEELLKETKGTGHPGQESARLGEAVHKATKGCLLFSQSFTL
uniref:Uncharacterized protein n=1 Tax=Balaenoptera musculus TaxID=9771 RepID=A0A8C0D7L9_BALMU